MQFDLQKKALKNGIVQFTLLILWSYAWFHLYLYTTNLACTSFVYRFNICFEDKITSVCSTLETDGLNMSVEYCTRNLASFSYFLHCVPVEHHDCKHSSSYSAGSPHSFHPCPVSLDQTKLSHIFIWPNSLTVFQCLKCVLFQYVHVWYYKKSQQ